MFRFSLAFVLLMLPLPASACAQQTPGTEEVVVLEVAPERAPCRGEAEQQCLMVRTSPDEPWQYFYGAIEGFTWEKGYQYRLRVGRRATGETIADASTWAYRLLEVLSKEPAQGSSAARSPGYVDDPSLPGTFSIVGRDPATGELGVAVHSKTVAVASRVRGGKGGVAVFAHQAASDPMYSEVGVQLIERGWTPQEALDFMVRGDAGRDRRQVGIVDIQGRTASYTGSAASDWKGDHCGVDYCAQGNTLTGPEVVDSMAASFEASAGSGRPLAERLLDALEAGQRQGGDRRGVESAGLLILKPRSISDFGDRELDLRVDESKTPFKELRRILNVVRTQQMLPQATSKLEQGDLAGALTVAQAAVEKSPEYDNAWVTLARVHLEAGRKDEALAALRKAVELNPANRRQLPANPAFESLQDDPAFRAVISGG